MEILFLGTSSGTPTKTRNVSAIALRQQHSKYWYLVDCGEGTQHQLMRMGLSLNKLQIIFITHVHGDHCYGLPGLLASAAMAGRTEPLKIVAPAGVETFFSVLQEATQLRLSYDIEFIDVESLSDGIVGKAFDIEALALSHRVPSFAYAFVENKLPSKLNITKLKQDNIPSGPAWGQLQKGLSVVLPDGREVLGSDYQLTANTARKIIIAGDNDSPELLAEAAKTSKVLVHEATYTEDVLLQVGSGPQHSSAKRVAQFSESVGIDNLVLTHFSPRYKEKNDDGYSIDSIYAEAQQYYKGNLFLANDFDTFCLDAEGVLQRK